MAENKEACWYVVHTYSGYENKVKANLEKIVENRGLQELITEVRIPMESVTEGEGEEAKTSEAKLLPSYVLIRMIMCDESWHVVRNITGVTGFVGPGSEPTPLTPDEVEQFQVEVRNDEPAFKQGDRISIVSGAFAGYSGVVQGFTEDARQVMVLVSTERRDIQIFVEIKDVVLAD